eukprot:m.163419 g.163419  ORF g.163419 m.163419 type:complete len:636 (-) comp17110_c11_seq1:2018-3925(-)
MLMLAMLSRCSEANLPLEPPRNIEVAHSSTVLFCGSMKPGEKVVLNTPPAAREARPSVLTIKENGRLLATSHACCLFAHPNEICNIVRLMHTADSPGCLCDAAAPICRDDFSGSGSGCGSGIDMSASADDADTDSLNLPSGEAGSTADDERSPFGIDSPCKETALSPQPQASLFPLVTAAAAAAAAAASHSSSHHGADRAPSASPAGSPLGSPGRSWPGASHFAFPTTTSTTTTNATTNTTVSPSPYNHRPFCPSPLSPARNNNSSFNNFGGNNNNSFNNSSSNSSSSSGMGYMQASNAAAAAPVMPTASPHLAYAPSAARKLAANDWFHASAAMPGRSALNASTYTRADSSLHNIHLRKPQPQHIEHQPHQPQQSQQPQQPNSEAAQLFPLMMDDAVASSSSSAARTPSPPFSMSPNNKEEKEAEAAAAAAAAGLTNGVAATTGEKALPLPRHDPMSTPKREDSLPGSPLVEKHLRNFKNLTLNTSARGSLFGGSPKDIASPLMSPSTPKSPRRRDSPLKLPPCSPSGRMVKDFHRPILTIQEDATVDYSSSDFEPTPSIPNLSADQTDIDSSAPTAVDIGDLVSRLNAMAACEGQCDSADGSLTLPLRHFDSKEVLKRFYATELGNDGPCSRA